MKRVICLYRVSTLGQVDHDDIPMQRLACHEYAAIHPDWEIVDEISEKGVSGYPDKKIIQSKEAAGDQRLSCSLYQQPALVSVITGARS